MCDCFTLQIIWVFFIGFFISLFFCHKSMTLQNSLSELSINCHLRLKFERVKSKHVFRVENSTARRVSEGPQASVLK